MTDRLGQQLGNYRLTRLLGQGGFAQVYLGEHIYLKTLAALKVLDTELSEQDAASFVQEAQTLARLTHPHIVRVLDFAVEDGTPFLVIEYASHGTLRQRHPKGARLDYEITLQMARVADNIHGEWQALMDLGFLWAQRDYTQTGTYYQQALALARHMDDPLTLAHSLNRFGNWHLNIEKTREALGSHQEALTLFQQAHDQHGLAETYDLLGMTSYIGGDWVQATTYYQQAVALFQQLDDRQGLASSLMLLGGSGGTYQSETVVSASISSAESLRFGELALKTAREIGQRSAEAFALLGLGQNLGSRGEYARALYCFRKGVICYNRRRENERNRREPCASSIQR